MCLFVFKDPTLPLKYPCHSVLPLRIADSFREVAGNIILGHSLTRAPTIAVELLAVVSVGRAVAEALKAWINSWIEDVS